MAYGRLWRAWAEYGSKSLHNKDFLDFYYGYLWAVAAPGLWFTRERSKVRSLVRPPFIVPNHSGCKHRRMAAFRTV
jgi:hypothetical protein